MRDDADVTESVKYQAMYGKMVRNVESEVGFCTLGQSAICCKYNPYFERQAFLFYFPN